MAVGPKVSYRKYMGDDAYSYALFIDGRPTYTGMDRREAKACADRAKKNIGEGRKWNA